jgi:hypothetical protein
MVDENVQLPPRVIDSLAPSDTAGLYVRLVNVTALPLNVMPVPVNVLNEPVAPTMEAVSVELFIFTVPLLVRVPVKVRVEGAVAAVILRVAPTPMPVVPVTVRLFELVSSDPDAPCPTVRVPPTDKLLVDIDTDAPSSICRLPIATEALIVLDEPVM